MPSPSPPPAPPLARLKHRVDRIVGGVLAALMGLAVVNVLWQVFTRFVLADPSAFTDELARFLLIWIGLLGASYAVGRRSHLAIDLLHTRLSGRPSIVLQLAVELLVFIFALAVLVIGGLQLVSLQLLLGQQSAALQVPLGYVYLALPLSGALILFYAAVTIHTHLRALRRAEG